MQETKLNHTFFENLWIYFKEKYSRQFGYNEVAEKVRDKLHNKFFSIVYKFENGQIVDKEFWELYGVIQKFVNFNKK
ncbi:MAG: hypothetical protein EBS06_05285 [Proteobacteria bacterium]|nr:hypothetical protein [Pseudomonadota bacterium]